MRLGAVVLVLLFAVFGAVFGALNAERVAFDLYFFAFELPKGAVVLVALLVGWIAGGLVVWALRVPRLRRELAASRRQLRELRATLAREEGGDGDRGDT
ncbi:MAG TPA: LapA family protein [Dokdonella sp.]|uniref:LapA family protein n=1 Tax=Dokdonella sp. TaxID=2291710 RepID=UPI0025C131B9|nr:LapA family protein [Dokdonella sp.]MBX3693186.1 LapA family protein [Dokdonella sp.]MCW5568877.1 LapA family protein [Dokdonella sp.]HNR91237.1 LapA family protein [Dokdonella sp.]